MYKIFFVLGFLALIFLAPGVYAQSSAEDVVYLTNGSIIRGIIIEQIPDSIVRIQTRDRSIFVYPVNEVLKITREESIGGRKKRIPLTSDKIKQKGFINITELSIGQNILGDNSGYAIDETNGPDIAPSPGIQTVNGFLFNPYFSAGAGIGLNIYSDLVYVPVFADFRVYFSPQPLKSFFSIGGGYSFSGKDVYGLNTERNYSGGVYVNPNVGVKLHLKRSFALTFSLGYRYQESEIEVRDYKSYYNSSGYYTLTYRNNYTLGYLITNIGFVF